MQEASSVRETFLEELAARRAGRAQGGGGGIDGSMLSRCGAAELALPYANWGESGEAPLSKGCAEDRARFRFQRSKANLNLFVFRYQCDVS